MSDWVGVVIEPSALAAIQANVLRPPPAPMISGMWWAGLGKAHDGPNDTNSPSYDASSWSTGSASPRRTPCSTVRRLAAGTLVVGELVGVPAEAGADLDPAAGEVVERGDLLGERDRVDSTGSATAVDSLIRDVTCAAVASEIHGSSVRV